MTFEFNFTSDQFREILPNNERANDWFEAIVTSLPTYNITTVPLVAAFLAQTCHESADYTRLHENLNYSAQGLIKTWPKRFNDGNADEYAHNPERIANEVYADRLGNGPSESGDGWNFRGRGPIQITGKYMYTELSRALFGDDRLLDTPEYLETDIDIAIQSACWFWNKAHANNWVDVDNFRETTLLINGGYLGEDDREERYKKYTIILQR